MCINLKFSKTLKKIETALRITCFDSQDNIYVLNFES